MPTAIAHINAGSLLQQHERLVSGLLRPSSYPHPVASVERIDTHVSTVLLAGDFAYKLRKPVTLGFLDFSTLERRRRDCEEELRLNRRTAPELYLDVVAVTGTPEGPRIGESSPAAEPAIDYAVRMRRFDPEQTFDRLAARHLLTFEQVDRIAAAVARLHRTAERAPAGYGTPEVAWRWMQENCAAMREHVQSAADRARLDALDAWSHGEWQENLDLLRRRVENGAVRDVHGDLHLGNIVLYDGRPMLFDAIEFNAGLRCIDVISDVAFAFMDLLDHGLPAHAWRFLSGYLELTGDYGGLPLLRLYAVYRALVRANVALIRLHQPEVKHQVRVREHTSFEHYLALAEQLREKGPRIVVVMTGLSGSGKSMVAQALAASLGGVRIRSDVERKRLFGLEPCADSGGGIYTEEATRRTYDRLATLADIILEADMPVVVDAANLRRDERRRFIDRAAQCRAHAVIVECMAPPEVLRERVRLRAAAGGDVSEATERVLDQQRRDMQPLDASERPHAATIETAVDRLTVERACDELAARLLAVP